ncbi:PCI-domain-containing protein [Suillus subluteus]|nr:PCI-domain-containing protein [Suillus subluteus]
MADKEPSLHDQESALVKLVSIEIKSKYSSGLTQVIILEIIHIFNRQAEIVKLSTYLSVLDLLYIFNAYRVVRTLLNCFNSILNSRRLEALQYKLASTRIDTLSTEFKRLSDKMILTEVRLLESRVYRGIWNLSKANFGVLRAEDKDDPAALNTLKYMLLCKDMLNMPEDVTSLLSVKLANQNLADFEKDLQDHKHELSLDPTACLHLAALYHTILQQNLLRIVELYSVVEIEYIAKPVGQGRQDVDAKSMILDKVFHGCHQTSTCLLIRYIV